MEWVETTGRTVDEAKELALDELGVDEADAEFQVVAEPRAGLFGRLRSEARVRARVRPTAPRSKEDRRDRRRRGSSGHSGHQETAGQSATPGQAPEPQGAEAPAQARAASGDASAAVRPENVAGRGRSRQNRGSRGPGEQHAAGQGAPQKNRRVAPKGDSEQREGPDVEVALDEQAQVAAEFLTELTTEFGLDADVAISRPDEETAELRLTGSDLGLLIGPKGATLLAIQNLTRTFVHHRTAANNGHINVDVGGYRQKRTEALARFAKQIATTVLESGSRTALEPMTSIDRKVVHDAIGEIDGVSTVSEGEEPRRRVVVVPTPAGD
jgi:spoIIIJ-associated protein